jgi:hypothetical protein
MLKHSTSKRLIYEVSGSGPGATGTLKLQSMGGEKYLQVTTGGQKHTSRTKVRTEEDRTKWKETRDVPGGAGTVRAPGRRTGRENEFRKGSGVSGKSPDGTGRDSTSLLRPSPRGNARIVTRDGY